MRRIILPVLTALICLPALEAQENEDTNQNQKVRELRPHEKAFTNLPEEKRKEYQQHRAEAARLIGQERIIEALDSIRKAQQIFPK